MQRLREIAGKPSRLVMGLMSGTSHDGVDAVIACIEGFGASAKAVFVSHSQTPYPDGLRARVREAFGGSTELICRLNFELGEVFATAALEAAKAAGLSLGEIDLIGSHGQTVYHIPPGKSGPGSTLQIAEGAVIARRTGAVTVSDFRTADIAAGGQGAPLVPMADWILFRKPGEAIALQNIGGIANVTIVTEELSGVRGFDTGPGNALLDEATVLLTDGKLSCDWDGKMAQGGKLMPDLLEKLLAHPYFKKKPPKSTGREAFGRALVQEIISGRPLARREDILCTLTHLTARSIKRAYDDFLGDVGPSRVALCGGGAKNAFLVSLVRGLFEVPVVTTDELGVPVFAREALCFAVLANETLAGNPGNVPNVTGASEPAVLGKISL